MTNLTATAATAASLWRATDPQLLSHRENAVFKITLLDGSPAALRLHRPGYQSIPAIEAELTWTKALATDGFPCPLPLPSTSGALVEQGPDGAVSVISWVEAKPIGPTETPQPETYKQLGRLLADMHGRTERLITTPLPRHKWDAEGLLGESPFWGRFWEHPGLTPEQTKTLQAARLKAKTALETAPDPQLIHADALQENVLDDGERLWLIDFDDAGYGYPGYDLGAALSQHVMSDHAPRLRKALYEGYGADPAQAPLYETLRACASLGWAASRLDLNHPKQTQYITRTLAMAQHFLG